VSQETSNRSFDELARGLASGSISRGRAIRLMGAALVGGTLASFPGVGWAAKGGRSSCAKFCQSLFGANTPEEAECVSQGTKGQGPCFTCTTSTGCGPNFTKPTCTVTGQTYICSTCRCECPSGATLCGGNCVSNCPTGQTLNPSTCQCECPSGTTLCGGNCVTNCPSGQPLDPSSCRCLNGLRVDCICENQQIIHPCAPAQACVELSACESFCATRGGTYLILCNENLPCSI